MLTNAEIQLLKARVDAGNVFWLDQVDVPQKVVAISQLPDEVPSAILSSGCAVLLREVTASRFVGVSPVDLGDPMVPMTKGYPSTETCFAGFEKWAVAKYPNPAEVMHVLNSYAWDVWQHFTMESKTARRATPDALLRSVFQRPDLSEHAREQFIAALQDGKDDLMLGWADFCTMAALFGPVSKEGHG